MEVKILKALIKTRFLKSKINFLLIMFLTMILQLHVNIILCYFLSFNQYVDFFIEIVVTILIGFYTNKFLNFVLLFEEHLYIIPRYFINNYSSENYRIWKRNFILGISFYIILILLFYRLEKFEIILQILQTVVSFLILDKLQQPNIKKEKIQTIQTIDPQTQCKTFTKIYPEKPRIN